MDAFILLGLVIISAVALLFCLLLRGQGRDKTPGMPYRKMPYLMSQAEKRFFAALREADANQHWLFTKVRLADLVGTSRGLDRSRRQSAFNRIKAKHVDFVLCDTDTMAPILVIELDDASHNTEPRQKRDAFVDQVAEATGLPILHVPAKGSYDAADLGARIQRQIQAVNVPADQAVQTSGAGWLTSENKTNLRQKATATTKTR